MTFMCIVRRIMSEHHCVCTKEHHCVCTKEHKHHVDGCCFAYIKKAIEEHGSNSLWVDQKYKISKKSLKCANTSLCQDDLDRAMISEDLEKLLRHHDLQLVHAACIDNPNDTTVQCHVVRSKDESLKFLIFDNEVMECTGNKSMQCILLHIFVSSKKS